MHFEYRLDLGIIIAVIVYMIPYPVNISPEEESKLNTKKEKRDTSHLGSSNAFEKTENPLSQDADNISDERLDELIGE
jgi:hypothetical protein